MLGFAGSLFPARRRSCCSSLSLSVHVDNHHHSADSPQVSDGSSSPVSLFRSNSLESKGTPIYALPLAAHMGGIYCSEELEAVGGLTVTPWFYTQRQDFSKMGLTLPQIAQLFFWLEQTKKSTPQNKTELLKIQGNPVLSTSCF